MATVDHERRWAELKIGEVVRSCPICGDSLKTQTLVQNHLDKVHPEDRPFVCVFKGCLADFHNISRFKKHLGKATKHTLLEPVPCKDCGTLLSGSRPDLQRNHRPHCKGRPPAGSPPSRSPQPPQRPSTPEHPIGSAIAGGSRLLPAHDISTSGSNGIHRFDVGTLQRDSSSSSGPDMYAQNSWLAGFNQGHVSVSIEHLRITSTRPNMHQPHTPSGQTVPQFASYSMFNSSRLLSSSLGTTGLSGYILEHNFDVSHPTGVPQVSSTTQPSPESPLDPWTPASEGTIIPPDTPVYPQGSLYPQTPGADSISLHPRRAVGYSEPATLNPAPSQSRHLSQAQGALTHASTSSDSYGHEPSFTTFAWDEAYGAHAMNNYLSKGHSFPPG